MLLMFAMAACQPSTTREASGEPSQAQQLYNEAMEIHDEVMPRMEEIMQLRQKLQLRVKSLQEEDAVKFADSLQRIQTAVQHLQQADQAMMQWMRSVEKVPGPTSAAEESTEETEGEPVNDADIVQIQQTQKEAILAIKQQMEASIEEAQLMIGLPE